MSMTIDELVINNRYQKLCRLIFKVLRCHSLWVFNMNHRLLTILISDRIIFKHYCDKQYFLHDPHLQNKIKKNQNNLSWEISLGTDSDKFKNCGFIYDLYKLFQVEEFVSVEKRTEKERYCFRFFTNNNRFVFINKFLNDLPVIKHFVDAWIEKYEKDFTNYPKLKLRDLKNINKNISNIKKIKNKGAVKGVSGVRSVNYAKR